MEPAISVVSLGPHIPEVCLGAPASGVGHKGMLTSSREGLTSPGWSSIPLRLGPPGKGEVLRGECPHCTSPIGKRGGSSRSHSLSPSLTAFLEAFSRAEAPERGSTSYKFEFLCNIRAVVLKLRASASPGGLVTPQVPGPTPESPMQ